MRAPVHRKLPSCDQFCAGQPSGPSAPDRRPKRRRRTLLTGLGVLVGGAAEFECNITDLSESGARIMVADGYLIPDHFLLIDVRGRVAYVAIAVWRLRREVGLRFAMTLPLASSTDPAVIYLRRAWLKRAVR